MAVWAPTLLLACAIEWIALRPALFERGLLHPVNFLAHLINAMERHLNRPEWSERIRFGFGIATLAVITVISWGCGWLFSALLSRWSWGWLPIALLGAFGLATRNLHDHVAKVLTPLQAGDLAAARLAVARIVGRDTETLDEAGIATAAIESLAESFCDGVIAPLFWFAIAGLGGLFAYKAINTADSLIGHKEPRWRAFGWAAARADDLLNLVPARLAGLLIVIAAGGRGWRIMLRDASLHASPNGGWPEAAMAGALLCRLGGPVCYDGVPTTRAKLGEGTGPDASHLVKALIFYLRANLLAIMAIIIIGIIHRPY